MYSSRAARTILFTEDAIGTDIVSTTQIVEMSCYRMRCATPTKENSQAQINELTELLYAFRHGIISMETVQHSCRKKFTFP